MSKNLEQQNAYLEQLESVLLEAVANGENPVELMTNLFTRHLLSDEHDPAHLNGLEFAELFELVMTDEQT